jgi:hypothetical protein
MRNPCRVEDTDLNNRYYAMSTFKNKLPRSGLLEQLHSPDGEKRCGADAARLLALLVMQVDKRTAR